MAILNRCGRAGALLALLLVAGSSTVVSTRETPPMPPITEAQAKATLLYNLPSFVDWPENKSPAPIVVGVVGAPDVVDALRQLAGRAQPPFGVRQPADGNDAAGCHVLFVSAERDAGSTTLLNGAIGRPVLTVGDAPGFTRRGGVIRIYFERSRLRFDINQHNADRAHLRLSSKLLALAAVVEQ